LTYFVLSYAFFWLVIGLFVAIVVGVLRQQPSTLPAWLMPLVVIAGSWMPALAAVIVTGTLDGRDGIRTLFTKFLRFRLPAKWYVAALIPFGLAFVAALIYKLAGAPAVAGVTLSFSFVVALVVPLSPEPWERRQVGAALRCRVYSKDIAHSKPASSSELFGLVGICP